jgi:hypothetical protein
MQPLRTHYHQVRAMFGAVLDQLFGGVTLEQHGLRFDRFHAKSLFRLQECRA